MIGLNLLRSGSKPLSVLLRSNSTKSSSLVQTITARKTSILLNKQVQKTCVRSVSAAAPADHSHSKQWSIERVISIGIIGIIPAALILENNVMDYILAGTMVIHSHWGLKMIATDYIHGPLAPKVAVNALTVLSILSFIGLCYFNYGDIGLSKAIKKIWAL